MIELLLPWPPSTNSAWRNVGGRVLISAEGRAYRTAVSNKAAEARRGGMMATGPMRGRLDVAITAYPPDNRRRDLDNLLKQPLDALTGAGLWEDDSQIDRLRITRGPVYPGGRILVEVYRYDAADSYFPSIKIAA